MSAALAQTAAVITRNGQGEIFQGASERFRALLTAGMTAGVFSMFEVTVQPGGDAPMHRHLMEDETFFLLEGRIAAYAGGVRHDLSAGDTIHFPPGVEHAFRVIGDEPARAVLILHPGGTEAFYRRMCSDVVERSDIEYFNRVSSEHGIEVTGPCPR